MGAIYQPKGKAAEYSKYAANFYNYCTGGCKYCYLNEKPLCLVRTKEKSLKSCFRSSNHAYNIFRKEADKNIIELIKYGLFFNFNSDPFLRGTIELNRYCIRYCMVADIPVKTLTKQAWWMDDYFRINDDYKLMDTDILNKMKHIQFFGVSLTGRDDLQPGCATTAELIESIKILKERGFKTWASIEPVIDIDLSWRMMYETFPFCDHYKVGIFSKADQKKYLPDGKYNKKDLQIFTEKVINSGYPVYLKDSILNECGFDREDLPGNCVGRDYL